MEPFNLFDLRLTINLAIISLACVFVLFVIFKQKNLILIAVTPFLLFLSIDTYTTIHNVLGTSTKLVPEGRVQVISSFVDNKKEWIHVWYFDEKTHLPKGLKVPYTKNNEKGTEESRKALRDGQNAYMDFKKKSNRDVTLNFHRLKVENAPGKTNEREGALLVPAPTAPTPAVPAPTPTEPTSIGP